MIKLTPHSVIHKSLEYLYGNPEKVDKKLVELYFGMTCRKGNPQALTERMESIARSGPWKQIPAITVPTLILWGKQDDLIPLAYGHPLDRDLPNSRLVVFQEAGHMPMEEIPQKSALATKVFLGNTIYTHK